MNLEKGLCEKSTCLGFNIFIGTWVLERPFFPVRKLQTGRSFPAWLPWQQRVAPRLKVNQPLQRQYFLCWFSGVKLQAARVPNHNSALCPASLDLPNLTGLGPRSLGEKGTPLITRFQPPTFGWAGCGVRSTLKGHLRVLSTTSPLRNHLSSYLPCGSVRGTPPFRGF